MEFFRRTYLTEGLRDLIGRAVRRIGGDANASPVINLQTNFGGGKTHSMLALWHLFSGVPLSALPAGGPGAAVGRPATTSAAAGAPGRAGRQPPRARPAHDEAGRHPGQHALGRAGLAARRRARRYELVAEADRTGTNPGEALHDAARASTRRAVILIDEWVAYARQLYGRDDLPGGTFDTQFTFAQTLTEAVKAMPGVLLADLDSRVGRPDDDGDVAGQRGGGRRRARPRGAAAAAERGRAASPTSGGRRHPRSRSRSCAAGCSRSPDAEALRHDRRDGPGVRRASTASTPASFPREARDTAYEDADQARPTRSTRSCSTGSTRTGPRWSGSSAPAGCCG